MYITIEETAMTKKGHQIFGEEESPLAPWEKMMAMLTADSNNVLAWSNIHLQFSTGGCVTCQH